MMLATRCPACGTSFRVVQDQLTASDGLVRCGRCNEVFNAAQALFSADVAEPPSAAVVPAPPATAAVPQGAVQAANIDETPRTLGSDGPASPITDVAKPEAQPEAADPVQPPAMMAEAAAAEAAETAHAMAPDEAAPAFLRQANRAATWHTPRARRALAAAAAVLSVTLAAQCAVLYRDTLAASAPASRPWLDAACALAGCAVEPLRRIGFLAVDASGLNQVSDTTLYRLTLVLRNRGDVELMLPAFDLVLTDTSGRTVARRVLTAAELGSLSRTLPSGGELALQANLNTGERPVAGYTIEIFYP